MNIANNWNDYKILEMLFIIEVKQVEELGNTIKKCHNNGK